MSALRYSLLDDAILTIRAADGRVSSLTLCELFPKLVRDDVADFPALRPHQRHVWHAFLVQVASLALHAAGLREMPTDPVAWRELLLGLTPHWPDGAAWALVAPPDHPALLQPPVEGGSLGGFKRVGSPDALDILVSARNHDIKRHVMRRAAPESWLYALVSLQTQEGFLGAGNYGISRMNGGFSSRPGLGIAPPGGPGARVIRDIHSLLDGRNQILEQYTFYPETGGLGLVWLRAWDGKTPIELRALDPFYIEICRRIRLDLEIDSEIVAWATSTKKERINAKSLNGRTGDPWTPLMADGSARKALTLDAGGFSYRRLVPLLFPNPTDPTAPTRSLLQRIGNIDADAGLAVVARGVVRGQGKTEGYHERVVPISRTLRRQLGPSIATDEIAQIAAQRVEDAGTFGRKVMFPAAMTIYTAAPGSGERARDDDTAKRRAGAVIAEFERAVDASFFVDLDAELEVLGDADAMRGVRASWLLGLRDIGRRLVDDTLASAPSAAMRRYRIGARARRRFEAAFHNQFGQRVPEAPRAGAGGTVEPGHTAQPPISSL